MSSSQDAGDATTYAYDPTKTGKSELPDGSAYALEAFKANKAKEPTTVGDMAAIREALKNFTRYEESDIRQLEFVAKKMIDRCEYGGGIIQAIAGSIREAKSALAKPPRQCDIGTVEERCDRHDIYCNSQPTCRKCLREDAGSMCIRCFAKWEQKPYKSEVTK